MRMISSFVCYAQLNSGGQSMGYAVKYKVHKKNNTKHDIDYIPFGRYSCFRLFTHILRSIFIDILATSLNDWNKMPCIESSQIF